MKIEGIGSPDITNSIQKKQSSEDKKFEYALQKAYSEGDMERLKEACKDFEGLMLQMMYSQMKRTVPESGLFEKSIGREIFESMLDEEIINNVKERGIGLAEMLYAQLGRNMEKIYTVSNEETE